MEPFYERAERAIGVAGDATSATIAGPRRHGNPMPPAWDNPPRTILQRGAAALGSSSSCSSVTDRRGRVHGHDNLFVADGSRHVINGGFDPVPTIMALAFRTAQGSADRW